MIIGYDAKRAFWNNTGLGNYSRFIISGISKYFPDDKLVLFTPGISSHPELISLLPSANVTIKDFGKGIKGKIRRITHFDTKHIHLYHGLSNELPFALKESTKKIVSIHDLLFLRYPSFYPYIDRNIYKWKVLSGCKKADLIIAISEQTKADLINFLNIDE